MKRRLSFKFLVFFFLCATNLVTAQIDPVVLEDLKGHYLLIEEEPSFLGNTNALVITGTHITYYMLGIPVFHETLTEVKKKYGIKGVKSEHLNAYVLSFENARLGLEIWKVRGLENSEGLSSNERYGFKKVSSRKFKKRYLDEFNKTE